MILPGNSYIKKINNNFLCSATQISSLELQGYFYNIIIILILKLTKKCIIYFKYNIDNTHFNNFILNLFFFKKNICKSKDEI